MKTGTSKTNTDEYISKDIIVLLRSQGMTLKGIGKLIGCTESFISMVGKGQRSLTIDHLAMLEKKLGKPLPILLLESIDPKKVNKQLKPLYSQLVSLVTGDAVVKARKKRNAVKRAKRHSAAKRVAV